MLETFGVILLLFHGGFCLSTHGVIDFLSKINSDSQPGRIFDGIGGLSGGGATSKLLINYKEPYRSQILDYLFKPNFGASLHMLKVEIGGDSQSTEGTEASHMHVPWEENYNRGYEWWLMKEAKKRNPDIILYGLPWAFPGWIGGGQNSPYVVNQRTATYIVKWVLGAKYYHNLTIDVLGIWNERMYNADYVKTLRRTLDIHGFTKVRIIVGDNHWEPAKDAAKDKAFNQSFYGIGAHYPNTMSTPLAKSVGKPLWSTEDYDTVNNDTGAGCWALTLNQNYVNGLISSTIAWNIVMSYYDQLPYNRCSLMTANEPWSGHYELPGPIWITAHTTQFTKPGWRYLPHGEGVGKLPTGGSYVSLLSPDGKDLTIIIETMTHAHSQCIRHFVQPYNESVQTVTFRLGSALKYIGKRFHRWESQLRFREGQKSTYFIQTEDVEMVNGTIMIKIMPDSVVTLSTINTARHGSYPTSPASKPFPVPYSDDFEGYEPATEPYMFTPQIGSFEVFQLTPHKQVVKQTVLEKPVDWCPQSNLKPFAIMGNYHWKAVETSCQLMIPSENGTNGAFLATRVDRGGCVSGAAKGIFVWLMFPNFIIISGDLQQEIIFGAQTAKIMKDYMHTVKIDDKGASVSVYLDGALITTISDFLSTTPKNGFVAIGTDNFGIAYFDTFEIKSATVAVAGPDDEITAPRYENLSKSKFFFSSLVLL